MHLGFEGLNRLLKSKRLKLELGGQKPTQNQEYLDIFKTS